MSTLTLPAAPTAPPSGGFALSEGQLLERRDAKKRRRKIDRAIDMCAISAWSLAIFAAMSAPFVFSSLKAAVIAMGLTTCAWFEFKGRAGLKRLSLTAPHLLARNQAALAVLVAVYCGWSAYDAWFGASPLASTLEQVPEVADMLLPFEELIRQITTGIYAVVLLITLIIQGFVIRYYASRRQLIEQYIAQTPKWVLQLDQNG